MKRRLPRARGNDARPLSLATRAASAIAILGSIALVAGCGSSAPLSFDLVITNGRVMDPETGLDSIRNVGIGGGLVQAISGGALAGRDTVDASDLVVAPGFIDLHAHGQTLENYRVYALDGVTTALELELGTSNVDPWYAEFHPSITAWPWAIRG